jgi:hypothetical protein
MKRLCVCVCVCVCVWVGVGDIFSKLYCNDAINYINVSVGKYYLLV